MIVTAPTSLRGRIWLACGGVAVVLVIGVLALLPRPAPPVPVTPSWQDPASIQAYVADLHRYTAQPDDANADQGMVNLGQVVCHALDEGERLVRLPAREGGTNTYLMIEDLGPQFSEQAAVLGPSAIPALPVH